MLRVALPLILSAALLGACSSGREHAEKPGTAPRIDDRVVSKSSPTRFDYKAPAMSRVGDLCLYRKRKDPIMAGYVDRTGAQWEGEIEPRDLQGMHTKWFGPSDTQIATVVARPHVDTFKVKIDDNCYDPTRKVYYACTKVLHADLARIRGFARAPTAERAGALAVQLCEKKVASVIAQSMDIDQTNRDMTCHVIEQAYCDLPKPPPPKPAAKKK
jgi:hypothetical protein